MAQDLIVPRDPRPSLEVTIARAKVGTRCTADTPGERVPCSAPCAAINGTTRSLPSRALLARMSSCLVGILIDGETSRFTKRCELWTKRDKKKVVRTQRARGRCFAKALK